MQSLLLLRCCNWAQFLRPSPSFTISSSSSVNDTRKHVHCPCSMSCCFNRTLILKKMNFHVQCHPFSANVPALVVPQVSHTLSQQSSILGVLESFKCPSEIKQVHALVVRTPPLQTQLIYNAIIQGLSTSLEAMAVYREMLVKGLFPNNYTLPFVLKACAQARSLVEGKQVHSHAVKTGQLASNVYVSNTLMRLYAICGLMSDVRKLFDGSPERDLVSWTTLIQGYVKTGLPMEGVLTFFEMCEAGFAADERMLVIVLSACAKLGDLSLGRRLYRYIHENGVKRDVFIGNALVDMFLKCGDSEFAHKIFDGMPMKNVISWNSMILGLAHQGKFKEALRVFKEMQKAGVKPDDVTLVGVLNSCANVGLLESGKWVHAYIDKHNIRADGFIGNALVDMYAKCGCIDRAFHVFKEMKLRDVYSYTAIIVGLAMHGEAKQALDIFSDMSKAGIDPDQVTFIGVLSACSHAGLVKEGQGHFEDMSRVYGLEPQTEHYGCLVDLLGRAGLFTEAEEIIRSMPMEPDAFVWGALLGACRIYGKVELGERVMKKLLEIEPEGEGAYILMSNIYSLEGKWKDAVGIRKSMKVRNIKKLPGCSSIELNGKVHEFRKGDKSHPENKEIWQFLASFTSHLISYGQEYI